MTQYSSISVTEQCFDIQIMIIQWVPMRKTEYFQSYCYSSEFSNNFPWTFQRINHNQKWHHRDSYLHPSWLQSATLRLRNTYFLIAIVSTKYSFVSSLFTFFTTGILCLSSSVLCFPLSEMLLPSSVLCFPSSVICSPSSILCFPLSRLCLLTFVSTVFSALVPFSWRK
jgi:hypothetical protein